jgi:long-chain acyl-CoA synthetase
VQVKLQDLPEMGYLKSDKPPRGLLWVKTPEMASNYFKDSERTHSTFDEEGEFPLLHVNVQ